MGKANETYSALFDLFTYWGYSIEAEAGKTLGQILQQALESGNSSEIYYQTLNDAIKRYPELENAKFLSPSWQQGGRYHSETYACVFELPNGDKYVAYRGTDDGGWIDNGQGMTQESTLMQREAAEYFDQMAEEHGWTEADNVYVTGHSKGGNKAQYVTLMSNHANLVDECHSLDGQGFSDEAIQSFKEKYGEEGYQEVLKKMYGYNGANDYVNPLGNTIIPKENIKYMDTVPNPDGEFAGLHMEEQMFQRDENGNVIAVLGEETKQGVMGEFAARLSKFLMKLPPEDREAAAMIIMQGMEMTDVPDGGGVIGIDGTTATVDQLLTFGKDVLPRLLLEILTSREGIKIIGELITKIAESMDVSPAVVGAVIVSIIPLVIKIVNKISAIASILEEVKKMLEKLGAMYNSAVEVLGSIISWIKDKANYIAEWFRKQSNSSDYSSFYVETSQLLHFKEELAQKKTQLEEKADRIREIRKRVDFGNITQQYIYFCLVSSARNLEKEAKSINKLSKGLQNCVKVYKQNEQKVIGIYENCSV